MLLVDRVAHFVGDLLTVRPSNCLAVLLRHLVALLSGHQVALLLRHVHAVLLWHCIAVLGGHPLALLLRHIVTLLLGQVVADWSGHKLALLPWDILALLLCHLVASLVCHFLALRHRVRLANTPRHFVATWSWVSCFPVTSFLPMPVTSLISRFSVSFSLGFPPPPEVASEPAIEASVGRQTSRSCRVNSMLSRVGSITVCSDKGRVRGTMMGCRWTDCVIHNLTSRLNGVSTNLLVLHPALLVLNRVAFLFKDSLALLLSLSGAHLLLVSVADVLIYSGALFFLGGLTMLFRDSATYGMRYNGAGTLLDSGADILVDCVALLFRHIVAHILIFWMALFVADWVTFLLVCCCTLFLLSCGAVLLWHYFALLSVDCRAHLRLDGSTDVVAFWFVEALV